MHWMRIGAGLAAALATGALAACGPVSGLETQARILSQPACSDFFFPIYFRDRSAEAPPATRRVVAAAGQRSRGCRFEQVKVIGLPDARAPAAPQLALARQRAAQVTQMLEAAGFPAPVFQLSPFGEAGAGRAGAGVPPRRVDVYVRFAR